MEDDQDPFPAPENLHTDDIRELFPDEELDADINNLSIEDSVAGPVVRISDDQVSCVPDSPPPPETRIFEKPFAIDINDEPNTVDSDPNVIPCTSTADDIDNCSHERSDESESYPPLCKPLFKSSNNESKTMPPSHVTRTDTPFSSAIDLVADKATGAISKTTLPNPQSRNIPDLPRGMVTITNHFKSQPKTAGSRRTPPNICTWAAKKVNSTPDEPGTTTSDTSCLTPDDALPQRPSRKRGRRNSSGASLHYVNNTDQASNNDVTTNTNRPEPNPRTTDNTAQPQTNPDTVANPSNNHTHDSNAKNVSFSLQGMNE